MLYQTTTATKKIFNLSKRIRAVSGGTSASKTISIMLWLINYAQMNKGEVISVVSETLPHLKRGAIRDFLNIMQGHNYFKEDSWNQTNFVYTFETGSIIEFFPVSGTYSDRVKGARRQVLFINEANNVSYEAYTQLEVRTSKVVWLDWNPVQEFWFYTEVLPHVDCDFITVTYLDNEGFSEQERQALETHKHNVGWWKVYGEGQLGVAEGRIYKDWVLIDDLPQNHFEYRLERLGLDFGYTNDPTALVAIYKHGEAYILDQILYRLGMPNREIANMIVASEFVRTLVIADSSEPKSIDELKKYGINIIGAEKGKDSVRQGIQFIQNQKIEVTKRSVDLIKEYHNYLWLVDRDGKTINEPTPIFNHAMDAIRYAMSGYFAKLPGDLHVPDKQQVMSKGAYSQWGGIPPY